MTVLNPVDSPAGLERADPADRSAGGLTEAAFLRRIVADPDDDLPRLVFADWLEEHDDPDRAEYIRVQCRLHGLSPAAPDYFDLVDRQGELSLRSCRRPWAPDLPSGFTHAYCSEYLEHKRGFPHSLRFASGGPDAGRIDLAAALGATTARHLDLTEAGAVDPAAILGQPAAAGLRGLRLRGSDEAALATALRGPAAAGLEELELVGRVGAGAMRTLAAARLDGLRGLTVEPSDTAPAAFEQMLAADWFARLRSLGVLAGGPRHQNALAIALGRMPELHTLTLRGPDWGGVVARAGELPSLARLAVRNDRSRRADQAALAEARLPALRVLNVERLSWSEFEALTAADWAPGLRDWPQGTGAFGARGVRRLAAVGATRLRAVGVNPVEDDPGVLAVLGTSGAFREVRELSLWGSPTGVLDAGFLQSADLPALTALELVGLQVDPAGVRAMCANPSFAGLTRLYLDGNQLGPAAVKKFLDTASERLADLTVYGGDTPAFAAGLCDPNVASSLRFIYLECDEEHPGVPDTVRTRLVETRGDAVTACR